MTRDPPPALAAGVFGRPLALARPPLCPELSLWLLGPEVDLEESCLELASGEAPPYWAFCWGSGQALARFVLDAPERVAGRRVVDFGAGSGVVALAAARAGARSVVAVDCDPVAREAVRENARANALAVEVAAAPPRDCDLLLAADVLYEPEPRALLLALAAAGRRVLVADPERHGRGALPAPVAARVDARTIPDVDPPQRRATIYELVPSTSRGAAPR